MVVAEVRHWLVPALKSYVDLSKAYTMRDFINTIEGWERAQPPGTPCFRKVYTGVQTQSSSFRSSPYQPRKPVTYFHCGKAGHISRECHSRLEAVRPIGTYQAQKQVVQAEPSAQTQGPQPPVASRPVKREVTCFTCHQKGHKFPQCPQKQNQVRRVQIPSNKIVALRDNELFGSVGNHCMPITCDSGADITVVPEECVEGDQFTGGTCEVDSFNKVRSTGKLCNVVISIAGRQFYRKAVTQSGKDLA